MPFKVNIYARNQTLDDMFGLKVTKWRCMLRSTAYFTHHWVNKLIFYTHYMLFIICRFNKFNSKRLFWVIINTTFSPLLGCSDALGLALVYKVAGKEKGV